MAELLEISNLDTLTHFDFETADPDAVAIQVAFILEQLRARSTIEMTLTADEEDYIVNFFIRGRGLIYSIDIFTTLSPYSGVFLNKNKLIPIYGNAMRIVLDDQYMRDTAELYEHSLLESINTLWESEGTHSVTKEELFNFLSHLLMGPGARFSYVAHKMRAKFAIELSCINECLQCISARIVQAVPSPYTDGDTIDIAAWGQNSDKLPSEVIGLAAHREFIGEDIQALELMLSMRFTVIKNVETAPIWCIEFIVQLKRLLLKVYKTMGSDNEQRELINKQFIPECDELLMLIQATGESYAEDVERANVQAGLLGQRALYNLKIGKVLAIDEA